MAGPLSHIRVLDLSRVLAGPWAGQNLADLGAEVIKVERPKSGDDSRAFGPPWVKDREGRETSDSAYFTSANRGKKSITVNIAAPEGQALIRALAASFDVRSRTTSTAISPATTSATTLCGRPIRGSSTAR